MCKFNHAFLFQYDDARSSIHEASWSSVISIAFCAAADCEQIRTRVLSESKRYKYHESASIAAATNSFKKQLGPSSKRIILVISTTHSITKLAICATLNGANEAGLQVVRFLALFCAPDVPYHNVITLKNVPICGNEIRLEGSLYSIHFNVSSMHNVPFPRSEMSENVPRRRGSYLEIVLGLNSLRLCRHLVNLKTYHTEWRCH